MPDPKLNVLTEKETRHSLGGIVAGQAIVTTQTSQEKSGNGWQGLHQRLQAARALFTQSRSRCLFPPLSAPSHAEHLPLMPLTMLEGYPRFATPTKAQVLLQAPFPLMPCD